ncbi:hypothetical protein CDAR_411141 [Caerostris darwini]|uniref:Uncharacterized protein n=1 Tax=Caerostris darwini TaxID=1538125 RepID=A0AAV4SCX6_9ARAC|nr:hypothetical protein CDAR_411141 [Caerostris darwini]
MPPPGYESEASGTKGQSVSHHAAASLERMFTKDIKMLRLLALTSTAPKPLPFREETLLCMFFKPVSLFSSPVVDSGPVEWSCDGRIIFEHHIPKSEEILYGRWPWIRLQKYHFTIFICQRLVFKTV